MKELEGQAYLRGLFGNEPVIDQTFPDGLTAYAPGDDLRKRAQRDIAVRQGQGQFRNSLINSYDSTCAVTGSTVLAVLEAAHIDRYYGMHTNHVTNGLLLRADIHTLFDLQRMTIDQDLRIRVGPDLIHTEYGSHEGKPLRLPSNPAIIRIATLCAAIGRAAIGQTFRKTSSPYVSSVAVETDSVWISN